MLAFTTVFQLLGNYVPKLPTAAVSLDDSGHFMSSDTLLNPPPPVLGISTCRNARDKELEAVYYILYTWSASIVSRVL